MSTALRLPKIAQLSDAKLLAMEPEEFTQMLLNKAALFGTDIMDKAHYCIRPMAPEVRFAALREWNR